MRLVAAGLLWEPPAGSDDSPLRIAEPLVSFLAPASLEADQYRTLRQSVERLRQEAGCQVIAVTSASAGEGKTVTTLNLAGSLAQASEARVLVIDADLHRPAVAEYLGLSGRRAPGLAEAILREETSLAQTARRLEALNISVLLSGHSHTAPYELLSSPRFEGVLGEARRLYDYVLIDTAPVVPLADCRLLARLVDGVIVVVAAHKTSRKVLTEALNLLDPAKIIGVVFNGDDRPLTAYYGYYGRPQAAERPSGRHTAWWRKALGI
jgi:capsular exopolysaccharide synthesis family protein